jgi:copper chaperone
MAQQILLSIDGMHCAACVRRVKSALDQAAAAQPGLQVLEVEIGSARLASEQAAAGPDFGAMLERLGFQLKNIAIT